MRWANLRICHRFFIVIQDFTIINNLKYQPIVCINTHLFVLLHRISDQTYHYEGLIAQK